MSLISVIQVKEWKDTKRELAVMCFDSRVNTTFEKGGKTIRTEYDGAQKVVNIGHNIIIGCVNEFFVMGVINDLKERIENRGYNQNSINHNISTIKEYIMNHIPPGLDETELLIIIKAHDGLLMKVYKLVIPKGTCVELVNNNTYRIDSIGSHADARNEVRIKFEDESLNEWIDTVSMDFVQKLVVYFTLVVQSAGGLDDDVGGDYNNLVMREYGWQNIGLALSTDNGQRWFANALGESSFELQINGRKHRELSSNPYVVEKELQKRGAK